ncbi:DnaD domain protein [Staphylococcus intermedius]|uniref:DnaD domain-containing protein n=1 Tax=Staphylococcus intermedius TaxID=1285 RepID=UPI001EE1F795|nr:DnaD domain protein [Staphylococcus intermedius]
MLEQKRLGLNKPNMLYLKKPTITQKDIYIIDNYENNLKNNDEFNSTKEVSKQHFKKCQNNTSKNVKTTPQEMSKQHSNDTDITTTTTKTVASGSSREKYLIKLIEDKMSIRPTKAFIEKIASLSINMSDELVEYAIKYAAENGNNPKQYLSKILEVWSNNHIYDLKQAQNFNVNSNINSMKSKEKTPRWITHPDEFKLKEENDQELETEAQAFIDHLTKKRRNYKE